MVQDLDLVEYLKNERISEKIFFGDTIKIYLFVFACLSENI